EQPAASATHRFGVVLEDGPWAAVRALQALLALGEHGRVISSEPSQADIEREDATIGNRLVVLVESDKPDQIMLEALNAIPELGSITVEHMAAPEIGTEQTPTASAPTSRIGSSTTIRIDVAR